MTAAAGDDEPPLRFTDIERRRGTLIDAVQTAKIRYDLTRESYARGAVTAHELLDAQTELENVRALLRAHDEVHPPKH